jgi:hypothetical protein
MDAFLNLRGIQWRVTLRNLTGRRGIGVHGLTFGLEFLSTTQASFSGMHAFINGHLFVGPDSGGMSYVGRINAGSPVVFSNGPVTTADLEIDLTKPQLDEIERLRGEGGVTLTLNIFGTLLDAGQPDAFFGQLAYRPDAGVWLWALEQAGYGKRVVTRVPDALS